MNCTPLRIAIECAICFSIIWAVRNFYKQQAFDKMQNVDDCVQLQKNLDEAQPVKEESSGAVQESDTSAQVFGDAGPEDPRHDKSMHDLEYLGRWIDQCKEDRFIYKSLLELCTRREKRAKKDSIDKDGGTH